MLLIVLLALTALLVCVLAAWGVWKPTEESAAVWFQRSGAIATVFCVIAQLRINDFLERIRGGTFAESWKLFYLFEKHRSAVSLFVTLVAVLGALIWGYGDLIFMYVRG